MTGIWLFTWRSSIRRECKRSWLAVWARSEYWTSVPFLGAFVWLLPRRSFLLNVCHSNESISLTHSQRSSAEFFFSPSLPLTHSHTLSPSHDLAISPTRVLLFVLSLLFLTSSHAAPSASSPPSSRRTPPPAGPRTRTASSLSTSPPRAGPRFRSSRLSYRTIPTR